MVGGLGGYQRLVELAHKFGGPKKLVALIFTAGVAVGGAIVSWFTGRK